MKICIVDDESEIRNLYSLYLEEIGCEVIQAKSGYEAISILKDTPVELVISDYLMAQGDGGVLASFCHDNGLEIVIVTASPRNDITHYLPLDSRIIDKISFSNKLFTVRLKFESEARTPKQAHDLLMQCLLCKTCDSKIGAA